METVDFKDYKTAAKTLVRNRNKDEDGNNISWLCIKWFRYDPNENGAFLFKYDYDDEFRRMPAANVGRRRKRSGLLRETALKQLYKEHQPISKAKYDDLMSLCSSMAIPREYHPFTKVYCTTRKQMMLYPSPMRMRMTLMTDNVGYEADITN